MPSKLIPDQWQSLLKEYRERTENAQAMGSAEKLNALKQSGRRNAREMIDLIVDERSFMELGTHVGGNPRSNLIDSPADALVSGIAKINGRTVLIGAEDFTVLGGSIGHGTSAKRLRLVMLAHQEKVPLIMLLDGAGERATNALERYPYSPNDLQELAALSGIVPTVALIYGSSAGHSALTAMLMDYVVMLQGASLFSAGPPLVTAALGEKVSKEALGGSNVHARSGVVHNVAQDETHARELIKNFLGFLPQSAWQRPSSAPQALYDIEPKVLEEILHIIPADSKTPYNIKQVIELIVDNQNSGSSFYEIQPLYGPSMVVGLARLGGDSIVIIANQPQILAGSITREAATKATYILKLADSFHLPVLFLADNPGVMPGSHAEHVGTLRAAAEMYYAQSNLRSPKLHVTLRKAFGFGSSLMAMNPFDRQTLSIALPGISLGGIPAISGSQAARLTGDSKKLLVDAEEQGAWIAGDTMAYDEIVDPRELRNYLIRGLQLALNRYSQAPVPKRHVHPQ